MANRPALKESMLSVVCLPLLRGQRDVFRDALCVSDQQLELLYDVFHVNFLQWCVRVFLVYVVISVCVCVRKCVHISDPSVFVKDQLSTFAVRSLLLSVQRIILSLRSSPP